MLTLEAAALLMLVRTALRALPFATLCRLLNRFCSRSVAIDDVDEPRADPGVARIGAAVIRAARRLPRMTCLVEATAADVMLRRRGYASTLKFGVRAPEAGVSLNAHAWVECAGMVVVGGRVELADYVVLTRRS